MVSTFEEGANSARSILFEENMLFDLYFICFIDKLNSH